MNPKFERLLLQVAHRAGEDGEYLPSLHTPEDIERFAELIVRECAEICMKEIDTGLLMAPQAPEIARQIREHFGVEE